MKVVNQCRRCGGELSAVGLCEKCTQPQTDTGILVPLKGTERQKKVAHISTICGLVLVLLTVGIGVAYAFNHDIVNAIRGVRAPDPERTREEAASKIDATLKKLGKNGAAGSTR